MRLNSLIRAAGLALFYALVWFSIISIVDQGRGFGTLQLLISLPLSFLIFLTLNIFFQGFPRNRWGLLGQLLLSTAYLIPLSQVLYFLTYKKSLDIQMLSVVIREPEFILYVLQNELTLLRGIPILMLVFAITFMNRWVLLGPPPSSPGRSLYFYFSKKRTFIFLILMIGLQVKWCLENDKSQLGIRPLYPLMIVLLASVTHALWTARTSWLERTLRWWAITLTVVSLYTFNLTFYQLKETFNLSATAYLTVFGAYFVQSSMGNMKQNPAAVLRHKSLPAVKMNYNVLIILNDSQRWDHLGINGFPKNTTADLDWLLKKSYHFQFPLAPSNSTDTSLPGLFYGLGSDQDLRHIKSQLLLWDYFSNGAHTFFISSANMKWSNLDTMVNSIGLKEFWALKQDPILQKTPPVEVEKATAQYTIERLRSFKQPWFGLWQSEANHYPYHTPPEHRHYAPCDSTRRLGVDAFRNCYLNVTHLAFQLYNDVLKSIDIENTVVVMTSDHGEGMNEHGMWLHGEGLHQEVIKVPFILYIPERLKKKIPSTALKNLESNTQKVTSVMDMVPTLLHLHELVSGQKLYEDLNLFSGKSLFTSWRERVVFSCPCYPQYRCYGRDILLVDENYYGIYNAASGFKVLYDTWRDLEQKYPLSPQDLDPVKFRNFLSNAAKAHPLSENALVHAPK